jgi:hypothetical protein
MTKATPTMEQAINGQMGQPAACMMDNTQHLPFLADPQGPMTARNYDRLDVQGGPSLARTVSTIYVDNFVQNTDPAHFPKRKNAVLIL